MGCRGGRAEDSTLSPPLQQVCVVGEGLRKQHHDYQKNWGGCDQLTGEGPQGLPLKTLLLPLSRPGSPTEALTLSYFTFLGIHLPRGRSCRLWDL